jgi:hypothetical protein
MRVKGLNQEDNFSRLVTMPDHTVAMGAVMDWIEERSGRDALTGVGHRVLRLPDVKENARHTSVWVLRRSAIFRCTLL